MPDYIRIIGGCFPGVEAFVPVGKDATVYTDIIFIGSPAIAQAALDASICATKDVVFPDAAQDAVDVLERAGIFLGPPPSSYPSGNVVVPTVGQALVFVLGSPPHWEARTVSIRLCLNFFLTNGTPAQIDLVDRSLIFRTITPLNLNQLIHPIGEKIPFFETNGTANFIEPINC